MKLLIIKLSSLGDVIHSLPMIYKLKQNYPDAQIDWMVGEKGYELLSLIDGLDNIYLPTLKNILLIQKQKYDYVIDVQGLFKSGLLSKLSLGKKIIGFKNTREFADVFYDEKINVGDLFNTKKHIVDLNLELVSRLTPGGQSSMVKFLIPKVSMPDSKGFLKIINRSSVVVFPATTWDSKHWPMEYWFEILSNLFKNFKICLCASSSDLPFIKDLIYKLDAGNIPYENLIGKTTIKDLIFLIQNTNLVIGLDSAGLHLASAIKNDYGVPEVIGIYGPTSPFRNGPYNLKKDCLFLSELECIACRKKECPLGHHKCMNDITPALLQKIINTKFRLQEMGIR